MDLNIHVSFVHNIGDPMLANEKKGYRAFMEIGITTIASEWKPTGDEALKDVIRKLLHMPVLNF